MGPGYFVQAGLGQWRLFNRARPLTEVLQDERVSARTRGLLGEVAAIKAFGEKAGLSATKNYTDYVEWEGPAVVWVVTACEPLAFREKTWSFPMVGGFNYLGWFDRGQAIRFAEGLKAEHWDTDVRGAAAYSTLGWFRDPVLSTMLADRSEAKKPGSESVQSEPDTAIAELTQVILHESVHATLHLPSEPVFNESLASFVAEQLTPRYFAGRGVPGSERIWKHYEAQRKKGESIREQLRVAYEDLHRLYESSRSESEKREAKRERLERLRKETGNFREWNNASLVQFKTYETGEREFERLFVACGGDLPRFLRVLQKGLVEVNSPSGRSGVGGAESTLKRLTRLAEAGCAL